MRRSEKLMVSGAAAGVGIAGVLAGLGVGESFAILIGGAVFLPLLFLGYRADRSEQAQQPLLPPSEFDRDRALRKGRP